MIKPKVEFCSWRLTCDSSFGVQELEKLLWEDAMTNFACCLWQRGNWGQTLGRCVQGARRLDQTVGDEIIKSFDRNSPGFILVVAKMYLMLVTNTVNN